MTVILITRKHHPIPVVNLANTGMVHFTQGNEIGALLQPLGGVICTILARYYPNTGKPYMSLEKIEVLSAYFRLVPS